MGLGLILGIIGGIAAISSCSSDDTKIRREMDSEARRDAISITQHNAYRPTYRELYAEKTDFFDEYRKLDEYLGRFVGKGSGGIYLLMKGIKFYARNVNELNSLVPDLNDAYNYRNHIAHTKSRWREVRDPYQYEREIIDKVFRIAYQNENYIARIIYKEKQFLDNRA